MTKRFWLALAVTAIIAFNGTVRGHEVGPHKGPIADWGDEEYHVEIVPDAKEGTVTVYIYGNHKDLDAGKTKPIDSKAIALTIKADKAVTIKLDPKPSKDDPSGTSSVFVGKHDIFKKEMKLTGTVSGKVGTKNYSGDFKQK